MKRIVVAVVASLTLLLGASAATADPDFGPGNSSKGPGTNAIRRARPRPCLAASKATHVRVPLAFSASRPGSPELTGSGSSSRRPWARTCGV